MLMMAKLPTGPLILVALGIGLMGYATLNFTGAIADPENRGVTPHGIMIRAADALTGALYVALATAALGIVVAPANSGIELAVEWASSVLALPFGATILALIGAALVGGGGYLFYRAGSEPFGNMLDRRQLSDTAHNAIAVAARLGTVVRAAIFGICGFYVIRAAVSRNPERVADVGDALSAIGRTTMGPLLLAVAGAGFVAYGLYQIAKSRYQRITGAS
jgi:hypothetical protein